MKMYHVKTVSLALALSLAIPAVGLAALKDGETAVFNELRQEIPAGKVRNIEELYKKWQLVQGGSSDAIILDIRTEAEFDAGHIIGSSNVDSGHAYSLPKKIIDPAKEIWVFCRTQHRGTYFAGLLYKYGYQNVFLVEGGIKDWAEKGYPLGSKYLGEISVNKYHKMLEEEYWYRENK